MNRLFLRWIGGLLLAPVIPGWSQNPWFDTTAFVQFPPARSRFAARPYLPLEVGNQWIYTPRGQAAGDPLVVEVAASTVYNGNTYFQMIGFAGEPAWVRYNSSGDLVQYAPGGPERLWYSFSALDGASWGSQLPLPCVAQATIRTHAAEVTVPAGAFSGSLTIDYPPGNCADAGLSDETFAPGVGLLRRTSITIVGPRTLELLYARVGGASLAGPELSFGVSIDRTVYLSNLQPPVDPSKAIPVLTVRFTLRNTSTAPVNLDFNTGQQYDVVIRDSGGREVYRWALGILFAQVISRLTVGPGEKNFVLAVPLGDRAGQPFPAGRYTLEAWLTPTVGKVYTATVGFEINQVQ